jgi:hypothetical protein
MAGPGREVLVGTRVAEFTAADVGAAGTRQTFVSEGIALTVNHVSYGKVDVEAVLAGEAAAIEITATADGRHYDRRGWCEGCGGADVRVERWTGAGREFHGWICGTCRRLTQSG